MLAPNEDLNWADKFIRKPPQLTLRCSGGMDDDGVLFVNGQLVARGPVNELTNRAPREFGLQPGDIVILELVQAGKSATMRLRTPEERAAGVKVCLAIEPLDNSETDNGIA